MKNLLCVGGPNYGFYYTLQEKDSFVVGETIYEQQDFIDPKTNEWMSFWVPKGQTHHQTLDKLVAVYKMWNMHLERRDSGW